MRVRAAIAMVVALATSSVGAAALWIDDDVAPTRTDPDSAFGFDEPRGAAPDQPVEGVLWLSDGRSLRGSLEGASIHGGIRWRIAEAATATFPWREAVRLELNTVSLELLGEPTDESKAEHVVPVFARLSTGERIAAPLVSLDETGCVFAASPDLNLRVPRNRVARIETGRNAAKGPSALNAWQQRPILGYGYLSRANRAVQLMQAFRVNSLHRPWRAVEGGFEATAPGRVVKYLSNDPLLLREFVFDASWSDVPALVVDVRAPPKKPDENEEKEAEDEGADADLPAAPLALVVAMLDSKVFVLQQLPREEDEKEGEGDKPDEESTFAVLGTAAVPANARARKGCRVSLAQDISARRLALRFDDREVGAWSLVAPLRVANISLSVFRAPCAIRSVDIHTAGTEMPPPVAAPGHEILIRPDEEPLTGTLLDLAEEGLAFQTADEKLTISPTDRAVFLLAGEPATEPTDGERLRVMLDGNSELWVKFIRIEDNELVGQSPGFGEVALPLTAIQEVRFR